MLSSTDSPISHSLPPLARFAYQVDTLSFLHLLALTGRILWQRTPFVIVCTLYAIMSRRFPGVQDSPDEFIPTGRPGFAGFSVRTDRARAGGLPSCLPSRSHAESVGVMPDCRPRFRPAVLPAPGKSLAGFPVPVPVSHPARIICPGPCRFSRLAARAASCPERFFRIEMRCAIPQAACISSRPHQSGTVPTSGPARFQVEKATPHVYI